MIQIASIWIPIEIFLSFNHLFIPLIKFYYLLIFNAKYLYYLILKDLGMKMVQKLSL